MSTEEGDKYTCDMVLTFGTGMFANRLPVSLTLPVKTRATKETKHAIELRALRSTFERQLQTAEAELRAEVRATKDEFQDQFAKQQQQLKLMALQMNQRVFFGTNLSIHMQVKKLVMVDPAGNDTTPFPVEKIFADGEFVRTNGVDIVFALKPSGGTASYSKGLDGKEVASAKDFKGLMKDVKGLMKHMYSADSETIM